MKYPIYVCLLMCCSLSAPAKEKGCKALVKANRKKTISFNGDLRQLEISFRTYDNHQVTIRHKPGLDSVLVLPDSGPAAQFTLSHSGVIQTPFIQYMDKGKLLTDSIRLGRPGAMHSYFGLYRSDQVFVTFNAAENSRMYYSTRGKDSFFTASPIRENSTNTWYDSKGTDTATRRWLPNGVMSYYSNKEGVRVYAPEGELETHTYDTLIANRSVSCRKTYYPDGKLRVVTYHFQGTPCGTWLFYDRKGKLSARKKYSPVDQLPYIAQIEDPSVPPTIFTFVEQLPDYPGGHGAFQKYVNQQLPALLCQSEHKLSGNYEVNIQIDNTGAVNIPRIDGLNADGKLANTLQQLLRSGGRWKPGKRNGRVADITFLMVLTVQ